MLKLCRVSMPEALSTLVALAAAAVSPLAFTWSATGDVSFHALGLDAIIPAVAVWAIIAVGAHLGGWQRLAAVSRLAIIAGVLGTAGLEVVRTIGFRFFQTMPGSMPMLMGVLLTDRIMEGPNWFSNLIGWLDHFWNGIGFAFIFLAVFGRQRWWAGVIYALGIGTIFMLSPVMDITGAGDFGQAYAPVKFPLTVYLAHIAFGAAVGFVAQHATATPAHLLGDFVGWPQKNGQTKPLRP